MKRVTCEGLDIHLTLQCATLDEVVLACDTSIVIPFRAATAEEGKLYPGITHVISVPGDLDLRGVQHLSLATPCGCYDMKLYFDCPAPLSAGKHTETPRPTAEYCCPPDPDEEGGDEVMDNNGDNDETV